LEAALALVGCTSTSSASVGSLLLTKTDVEVVRAAIEFGIQPRIRQYAGTARLQTATVAIARRQAAQVGLPSPPPSPASDVADFLKTHLTADERASWLARNGSSFEIPELRLSGLLNRREEDLGEGGPIVSVSAPIYPMKGSAVIYAGYSCGGLCGEGFLIRLRHDSRAWRVTSAQLLWIS
jgi:hypothetical protein